MAELVTRPFRTTTPSARRRRACSLCSRDRCGNTMRPPAPTTRCQGKLSPSGAILSANPAWRARPGNPAARATAPYVETCPRGMAQTTCHIASSAGFVSAADRRRDRGLSALKGRNKAWNDFFISAYPAYSASWNMSPRVRRSPRYTLDTPCRICTRAVPRTLCTGRSLTGITAMAP